MVQSLLSYYAKFDEVKLRTPPWDEKVWCFLFIFKSVTLLHGKLCKRHFAIKTF